MQDSSIEWTTKTWNPVTGCTRVSPGCEHCYAETFAERWRDVPGHAYEHGFDLQLRPRRLLQPLRWTEPLTIFVNSMSDLFHVDVRRSYIDQVWDVMASTPQHTYQVLTKRAERMERVCSTQIAGPLPNVWLGVSVESPAYHGRIRHLQRTPAAVRFLSCEPLLVIVGGESGPGARPLREPWVEEIIAQCQAAGAAIFVKQLGTAWARGRSSDRKGGRMADWPHHLRIRELPGPGDAADRLAT
jgi:protein gp37